MVKRSYVGVASTALCYGLVPRWGVMTVAARSSRSRPHNPGAGEGDCSRKENPLLRPLTFLSSFLPARLSVMTRLSDSSWAAICEARGRGVDSAPVPQTPRPPAGQGGHRVPQELTFQSYEGERRGGIVPSDLGQVSCLPNTSVSIF